MERSEPVSPVSFIFRCYRGFFSVIPSEARDLGLSWTMKQRQRRQEPRSLASLGMTGSWAAKAVSAFAQLSFSEIC